MKDNIIEFPNTDVTTDQLPELELVEQIAVVCDEIRELSKVTNRLIRLIGKQSAEIAELRQRIEVFNGRSN